MPSASQLRRLAETRALLEQALPPLREDSVLGRIEKAVKRTIHTGRENLFGYPVDINDKESTPDYVVLRGVDQNATRELIKKFRQLRFKVTYHKPSDEITIE